MVDLRADLQGLAATAARARQLADRVAQSELDNDAVAAASGHPVVAGAIGGFANWWSIRRGQLVDDLRTVAEGAEAMHETFAELDAHLAQQATATLSTVDDGSG